MANRVTHTAPARIWLQVSDDPSHSREPFPATSADLTWCADSVLACEVEYVRADLRPRREARKSMVEKHFMGTKTQVIKFSEPEDKMKEYLGDGITAVELNDGGILLETEYEATNNRIALSHKAIGKLIQYVRDVSPVKREEDYPLYNGICVSMPGNPSIIILTSKGVSIPLVSEAFHKLMRLAVKLPE